MEESGRRYTLLLRKGLIKKMDMLGKLSNLRNVKMPQKFIAVFIFLFIFPTSIISLISYRNYVNSLEKSTTAYVTQISIEMMKKLDEYISKMKSITLIPYYLPDMQKVLQSRNNTLDKAKDLNPFIDVMNGGESGKNNKNDKIYVYVLDNVGNVFFTIKINDVRTDIQKRYDEFRNIAYKASGGAVLLGAQKISTYSGRSKFVLTVVRSIRDLTTYDYVGFTMLDVDLSILESTVNKLDSITKGRTTIIDQDNNVIYDSEKLLLGKKFSESGILSMAKGENGSFNIERQGRKYVYIYSTFPDTGWKMIINIQTKDLFKDAANNSRITLVIVLITGALALLIYVALSYSITNPLRKLALLMIKVGKGDMNVHFDVKYGDEVGMVASSFNKMVSRIKELIEEVYVLNIRKKQAELDALQGQINPHFIYNTLETIRMLSVLHGVKELAEISRIFGKLLRYSVNCEGELVSVRDELNHLENYIYLQNKRFSNKFVLEIDVQDAHKEFQTIKLIFQPIVENAILHGLENKKGQGKITITSEETKEFTIFKIGDNGNGINADALHELVREMHVSNPAIQSKKHIGLRNVNERIKLYFGEKYGLDVESELGVGTAITLKLPAADLKEDF